MEVLGGIIKANYIGSIDRGTTSTRFIVFDRSGHVAAIAQKEHGQIYPQPGWVEHNPEEIWQAHSRGDLGGHGPRTPSASGPSGHWNHEPA